MDCTWVFLNKELLIQPRFEVLFELLSVIAPLLQIRSSRRGEESGRETYLVQLVDRHHVIFFSSEDTNGNGVDILQIGLNEERRVESNSDISLDW